MKRLFKVFNNVLLPQSKISFILNLFVSFITKMYYSTLINSVFSKYTLAMLILAMRLTYTLYYVGYSTSGGLVAENRESITMIVSRVYKFATIAAYMTGPYVHERVSWKTVLYAIAYLICLASEVCYYLYNDNVAYAYLLTDIILSMVGPISLTLMLSEMLMNKFKPMTRMHGGGSFLHLKDVGTVELVSYGVGHALKIQDGNHYMKPAHVPLPNLNSLGYLGTKDLPNVTARYHGGCRECGICIVRTLYCPMFGPLTWSTLGLHSGASGTPIVDKNGDIILQMTHVRPNLGFQVLSAAVVTIISYYSMLGVLCDYIFMAMAAMLLDLRSIDVIRGIEVVGIEGENLV